jgi:uncharacterized protein
MDKRELILACLSTGEGESFSPVQIQKMLFLIDQNISKNLGGKFFDFKPYNYGPFDKSVYEVLEQLQRTNEVDISPEFNWRVYLITEKGKVTGDSIINSLDSKIRDYIINISRFVRSQSFSQLVKSIYKEYPEMKKNSVFQD